MFQIYRMPAYEEWYCSQPVRSKLQIEKRLEKIVSDEYFGHQKDLEDGLFELKFNDGRRIYFTFIPVKNVILLLGGNKNGQSSDITKAKNSIKKAKEAIERTKSIET